MSLGLGHVQVSHTLHFQNNEYFSRVVLTESFILEMWGALQHLVCSVPSLKLWYAVWDGGHATPSGNFSLVPSSRPLFILLSFSIPLSAVSPLTIPPFLYHDSQSPHLCSPLKERLF